MVEPYDIGNVKRGKVGVFQWLKEWMSTDCYYFYNSKDKSPFSVLF